MHFESGAFCIHCHFHQEICLCHHVRQVETDLRIIVVLHVDEVRKQSNTGRLAKLVVPNCRVTVHGPTSGPRVDLSELAETHDASGRPWRTLLFYPGMGAEPLTPELCTKLRAPEANGVRPRLRLIVPDGTWSQARRLVKRLPELSSLPRIILPVTEASVSRADIRPRTNHDNEQRVSTCEAIATAIGMLDGADAEAALLRVYDEAALRIGRQRGKFGNRPIK